MYYNKEQFLKLLETHDVYLRQTRIVPEKLRDYHNGVPKHGTTKVLSLEEYDGSARPFYVLTGHGATWLWPDLQQYEFSDNSPSVEVIIKEK